MIIMKLTILGGGNEIGASCYLLTHNEYGFIIDAGIRINNSKATPSLDPIFKQIESYKKIKALFITHAHLDHIGFYPKFFEENRNIKIYVPLGSKNVIYYQFESNWSINKEENNIEIEYSHQLIWESIVNMEEVQFGVQKKVPGTNIYFEFWPAGHIIGSASIYIRTPDGTILFTGDICKSTRYSVPNLSYKNYEIDFIVSESTYLHNKNAQNNEEEFDKLFKNILNVVANKGIALIPCFALGKAQEIIKRLILKSKETSQKIPIYLDGLVQGMTDLYHIQYSDDFLTMEELYRIRKCALRKNINDYLTFASNNRGIVVIASSGMILENSRSAFWVQTVMDDPRSAIFFSGYLDEESPGYLLSKFSGSKINLYNREFTIKCEIKSYYVGTHISRRDLIDLIASIPCKKIFLVHGNNSAEDVMEFQNELEQINHKKYIVIQTENEKCYELSDENGKEC